MKETQVELRMAEVELDPFVVRHRPENRTRARRRFVSQPAKRRLQSGEPLIDFARLNSKRPATVGRANRCRQRERENGLVHLRLHSRVHGSRECHDTFMLIQS
jgi:hypothetical protein